MDIRDIESAWLSGTAQWERARDEADAIFFKPLAESIIAMAIKTMPEEAKQYVDPMLLEIAGEEETNAGTNLVSRMVEEPAQDQGT